MEKVIQGAAPRLYTTFRNVAGDLDDPDDVQFWIETPTEWATYIYGDDVEVVRVSEGIYYLDVQTIAESGVYQWRVTGTSPAPGAEQGEFYVVPMSIPETEPA